MTSMNKSGGGSGASIRSFVAIDISNEIRVEIDNIIGELKSQVDDIRWVKAASVHLTLKFLGDVSPDIIPSLRSVMEGVAQSAKPFKIEVKGLGAFPNPRRVRVVWIGVHEPSGVLEKMAVGIDRGMASLGFEPEKRAFRPHLTLGRMRGNGRSGKELAGLIDHAINKPAGNFTANEITLFRSDLKPTGAVYTKLETVKFGSEE